MCVWPSLQCKDRWFTSPQTHYARGEGTESYMSMKHPRITLNPPQDSALHLSQWTFCYVQLYGKLLWSRESVNSIYSCKRRALYTFRLTWKVVIRRTFDSFKLFKFNSRSSIVFKVYSYLVFTTGGSSLEQMESFHPNLNKLRSFHSNLVSRSAVDVPSAHCHHMRPTVVNCSDGGEGPCAGKHAAQAKCWSPCNTSVVLKILWCRHQWHKVWTLWNYCCCLCWCWSWWCWDPKVNAPRLCQWCSFHVVSHCWAVWLAATLWCRWSRLNQLQLYYSDGPIVTTRGDAAWFGGHFHSWIIGKTKGKLFLFFHKAVI